MKNGRSLFSAAKVAGATLLASTLFLTSCETHTQEGALIGGLGGAAAGGLIGGRKGALIGGAAGAAGGALIGNKKDKRYGY